MNMIQNYLKIYINRVINYIGRTSIMRVQNNQINQFQQILIISYLQVIKDTQQSLYQQAHVYDSLLIKLQIRFLKQYDISLTYLHQALLINPNHTFSLDRIGNCLQDQEKYLEALIYYERKLKIQPNDQWTKNQKEFCEEKLKN
ncbi:unnamed protein product [Paramecium pentaurelia]|uniref:Tetratricopeptide repeat protein n=1 Tax=Paramecium pentaurelia TaxID=43138 RepID=A0A8S1XA43_9CILI|nr:unnamed protein product [Paramecium pentaurelia]